eukprot:TRINITY_DN27695_c0_g1_i2.p1 TRINITY_DN27695_c0_g1~~TRINITY_DN27695_c0_g1_i2.p1  ORF type:complete len:277 (+),score=26.37 TRINITY_DN27695_c0_g1_i2:120-950(+)
MVVHERTLAGSATAGGCAAAAATVAFHPLDTIKTVLQQQAQRPRSLSHALASLGVSGLYRGVTAAALSMMPACAVRMGSYEVLKNWLPHLAPGYVSPAASVTIASSTSVIVSAGVRAPLDMIKVQLQAGAANSMRQALRGALKSGVGGLYRGAGLSLMRDVPFFSINLVVYEQLRALSISLRTPSEAGTAGVQAQDAFLIGAVSNGCGGFCTNPLDVLKTRVQTGAATNMRTAFRTLVKDDGLRGLMRGAGMRVLFIAPQGCVFFPVYEFVQRHIH